MDKFDREILHHLQSDASMSNALIGEQIGLSASQVSRRRTRLESDGIIAGYRALINGEALGLTLNAFIKLRLHAHSREAAGEFKTFVRNTSAIRLACAITGDADYLLHVQVRDLNALSDFIGENLLAHPLVREVRSDVVLDLLKDDSTLNLDNLAR